MITLAQLLIAITPTQMRNTLIALLISMGVPADKWRPRGTYSSMLTVVATQLAGFSSTILTPIVSSFYLPTAKGQWLTLVAWYVYGVLRPAATFASGQLTLTNTGGGVYPGAGDYPAGGATFVDSSTGATFSNTAPFSVGALQTVTINVQATVAGAASSASPGDIDKIQTSMLGVVCTNPYQVTGLDALDDPSLITLCLNKLGALSVRGVRSAYGYAIQTAVNAVTGAPVNINRWQISPFSHTGQVFVWVASPSGAADPNDVAGVVANIEAIARPSCVTVSVFSAAQIAYNNGLVVYARTVPGLDEPTLTAQMQAAIAAFFSGAATNPIGGIPKPTPFVVGKFAIGSVITFTGFYGEALSAAISACNPAIYDVDGCTDLALLGGQVAANGTSIDVRFAPGAQG